MLTAATATRLLLARLTELNEKAGRPTEGHPLQHLARAEQDEHHDLLNELVHQHPDESNTALLAEYDKGLSSTSLIDYAAAVLAISRHAIPGQREDPQ